MEHLTHQKNNLGIKTSLFKEMEVDIKKSKAPHDLASIVDEIIKVTGVTKKYGYKFWCGKVKRSKLNYNEILKVVDKAEKLDKKYNVGGFINNNL